MLVVVWVLRLEINLKEIGILLLTYIISILVWYAERITTRGGTRVEYSDQCIAPPLF